MPNLKKTNVAHVATFYNFKLKRISRKKFKPAAGKPSESMGKQKVRDLAYYVPAASIKVNLKEAQLQAYNLLDFVFDNKDTFQTQWHSKYNTDAKKTEAYSELATLMANPAQTVYDIAEKLDDFIQFKGESEAAQDALEASDDSFETNQNN